MALSPKLTLRQGQALVMTPQLLQAIKLLQFSNVELAAFVEAEIERNPLLERVEESQEHDGPVAGEATFGDASGLSASDGDPQALGVDWSAGAIVADDPGNTADPGPAFENSFSAEPASVAEPRQNMDGGAGAWTGVPSPSSPSGSGGEPASLEAYVAARPTLRENLGAQLGVALTDGVDLAIGQALVDSIDENGYLSESVDELAARLGVDGERAERILAVVQTCEPSGVGARNLAECLAIQLRDKNRYDPAMAALLANLPLLARKDFAALEKICGVDAADVAEMAAEIRRLDPKPGRMFGDAPIRPAIADVIVSAAPDGGWRVELNSETLPKLLVNEVYAAKVMGAKARPEDKSFVANCLQNANWLAKSLDQRARTILKVSSEIVRQQDAFFSQGVAFLRPLNLKNVADAIGMHESTVSRVTSNKCIGSPRGLFELKYFFTVSISSNTGSQSHSAESVRYRIKQLIDQESAQSVLSDDAIVAKLKSANIDIARRTVAKYREGMRIASSVERRREKLALAQAAHWRSVAEVDFATRGS